MDLETYKKHVKNISCGKQLPDSLYLHVTAFDEVPEDLQSFIKSVQVSLNIEKISWNVIKFFKRNLKISILYYPKFVEDSYPALSHSISIDLKSLTYKKVSYKKSKNLPILHRKKTFIAKNHPLYSQFVEITEEGEKFGLYSETKRIGFKENWERFLAEKGYMLVQGRIKPKLKLSDIDQPMEAKPDSDNNTIERHKTAIDRNSLLVPIQSLFRHNYLNGHYTLFDYGCGFQQK